MADTIIPDDLLALLRSVDTPTVCNAIEVAPGQDFEAFEKARSAFEKART